MYNKNIDKNELAAEYHWVIFTQEEWAAINDSIKDYSEKYKKLSKEDDHVLSDFNEGISKGFQWSLDIINGKAF